MSKRLDALRKRQEQLAAQIKDAEKREREQQRKRDTRRKIIVGALTLHHMEKNQDSDFARKVAALIEEYVTKDNERALFDLEPLPKNDDRTQRPDG